MHVVDVKLFFYIFMCVISSLRGIVVSCSFWNFYVQGGYILHYGSRLELVRAKLYWVILIIYGLVIEIDVELSSMFGHAVKRAPLS